MLTETDLPPTFKTNVSVSTYADIFMRMFPAYILLPAVHCLKFFALLLQKRLWGLLLLDRHVATDWCLPINSLLVARVSLQPHNTWLIIHPWCVQRSHIILDIDSLQHMFTGSSMCACGGAHGSCIVVHTTVSCQRWLASQIVSAALMRYKHVVTIDCRTLGMVHLWYNCITSRH